MAPALVLFDIDGTLVRRAGPQHRTALVTAVRHVTGVETTTEEIPVQGMLDRDILRIMMRNAGVSAVKVAQHMPAIVFAAQASYASTCPDLRRKVCPGVRILLRRLQRKGFVIALVTGNLTLIGWAKVRRAGIAEYFRYGVFAEEAKDRAGLVRIAVRVARQQGWIERDAAITLIGDHENDILAAKANGIRVVSVATGISSANDLKRLKPDVLLADLRALELDMLL